MNKYLFFRGIAEYNKYKKQLITDLLASFTYIPGTVLHFGYGSLYEKTEWINNSYQPDDNFKEMKYISQIFFNNNKYFHIFPTNIFNSGLL